MATASYEAREFGVRSGMPLRTALKRCPDAVFLPVDKAAYDAASAEVMATLRELDAVVEVLGWDEAFLGVETDDPEALAREIQRRVLARTALHCSVGIGDNKLRAKTRDRVRQAGRGVPADPRRLGRADGRATDRGAVGDRPRRPPRKLTALGHRHRPRARRRRPGPAGRRGSARRSGPGWSGSVAARTGHRWSATP